MVEPVNYMGLMSQIDPLQGYISGMESGLLQQGERQNQALAADQNARAQAAEARAAEMQPYAIQGAELGLRQGALALEQGQFNLDSGRQQMQMQQEQAQRQQAFQERMAGIHARGSDVTLADFGGLMTEFPEYADALSEAWDGIDAGKRASMGRVLASASFALKNGNTDVAQALVSQFTTAARNSGDEALAATAEGLGMIAGEDPQAAMIAIGSALYALDADLAGQVFEAGDANAPVGSPKIYSNGLVQQPVRGGGSIIMTAGGQRLEGADAEAAIADAMATEVRQAGLTSGGRAEATADVKLDYAQEINRLAAMGTVLGEAEAKNIASAASDQSKAELMISLVNDVLSDPALDKVLGPIQGGLEINGAPLAMMGGADVGAKIEQLQGQAFLQAFESLKGGGAITEREGAAATNAIARIKNRRQSAAGYRAALEELRSIADAARSRAAGYAIPDVTNGATYTPPAGQAAPAAPAAPAGQPLAAPSGGLDFLGGY